MQLDSWQYGNPEYVLERKQEAERRKIKGCAGCIHHKTLVFQGENLHRCAIKKYMIYNCKQYKKVEI